MTQTRHMLTVNLLSSLSGKCDYKMQLGKVIGNVVSTNKEGNLAGLKIMVVAHLDENMSFTGKTDACIDTVSAGDGDLVILCSSSSARVTGMTKNTATDNAIVGIIDTIVKNKKSVYRKTRGA